MDTPLQPFAAWAEAHGVTMTAAPTSGNPNMTGMTPEDKKWAKEAAHWLVTLAITPHYSGHGERPKPRHLASYYSMGAGHRCWTFEGVRLARRAGWKDAKVGGPIPHMMGRMTMDQKNALDHGTKPTPPEIGDVLNSMGLDSRGVRDALSFEDWADEYGYEKDSRSFEACYRACQKIASELRAFLGFKLFDELLGLEEGQEWQASA